MADALSILDVYPGFERPGVEYPRIQGGNRHVFELKFTNNIGYAAKSLCDRGLVVRAVGDW